ncbi:MAG: aminotransferase class IV [Rhodobiaceae bacterium]|nr:aminotransferase class IV [Rhodobiaceae bacterium]
MKLWLNGKIVDANSARIAPNDRGFLLGDGLFETLLIQNGTPVFLAEHHARLLASTRTLAFPSCPSLESLTQAIEDLLKANDLEAQPRIAARITLARGPAPRGILPPANATPTCLISVAPSPTPPTHARAIIATPRRNDRSPLSGLKMLGYQEAIFAKQEAAAKGVEEAVLLNTQDELACTSVGNIFCWFKEARLVTPPLSAGILPGITRAKIIELAREQGLAVHEETITQAQLATATGAFSTNSLVGLQTLSELDGHILTAPPEQAALQKAYDALLSRQAKRKGGA